MAAMIASSNTASDSRWYPDSGATNCLTHDLTNLMNKVHFDGNDQVRMGDGSGLDIHHIGSSFFQSPFNTKVLNLKHLLHVPSITKNLLSVSQFAKDNKVFLNSFLTIVVLETRLPTTY